jgi:hypothetical protein
MSGKLLKYFIRIELKNYNKQKKINKKIIDEQKKTNKTDKINELKTRYLNIVKKQNDIYKLNTTYLIKITKDIINGLQSMKTAINKIEGEITYKKMEAILKEEIMRKDPEILKKNPTIFPDKNDPNVKEIAKVFEKSNKENVGGDDDDGYIDVDDGNDNNNDIKIENDNGNNGNNDIKIKNDNGNNDIKIMYDRHKSKCIKYILIGSAIVIAGLSLVVITMGLGVVFCIAGIFLILSKCARKNIYINVYIDNIIILYNNFITDIESYNQNVADTCVYTDPIYCKKNLPTRREKYMLKKIFSYMDKIFEQEFSNEQETSSA